MQNAIQSWLQATNVMPKVPRFWGKVKEIHIFSDASEEAYAATAYAVTEDGTQSTLMIAKTRVKPTKESTIPRLELQGAALAAQLYTFICQHLGMFKTTFWSDSHVVLGCIKSDSSKYKQYVGNRINAIQSSTDKDSWNWVPSKENPADIISRGIWPPNENQMKLCLNGPSFITNGCYPVQPYQATSPLEEIRATAVNGYYSSTSIHHRP